MHGITITREIMTRDEAAFILGIETGVFLRRGVTWMVNIAGQQG
jgi:hypothetical protein